MAVTEHEIVWIVNLIRSKVLTERDRIELASKALKRLARGAVADFVIPDQRLLCEGCGEPMDDDGRSDRRFHRNAKCRKRAQRKREQERAA